MANSGVKVSDEAHNLFLDMKMKKKHRYMTMLIDGALIVKNTLVEKTDDQKKDFEDFVSNLPKDSSCYIILDLTVPSKSGGKGKEVLFYISWCPDTAGIHNKMVYASTRQAFLNRVKTGVTSVQANDLTDIEYDDLLSMKI